MADWPVAQQQELREFLREDAGVGVLIASSERSALEGLTGPDGPLRYVATRLALPPIGADAWRPALRERFAELQVPIDDEALEYLLDESRGHPYCTMFLAREAAIVAEFSGHSSIDHVRAGLLVAQADEAWELRDDQLG